LTFCDLISYLFLMERDESIYQLLAGLAGVKIDEKQVTPVVEPDRPIEKPVTEPENTELAFFHEAMEGVKKLGHNKDRILPKTSKTSHSVPVSSDPRKLLEEALADHRAFNVTNLPEYMEGFVEGINPLTMEKLRSSEFSIQKVLDLHGYTVTEAHALFGEFLRDAIQQGLNCIKIIHGRGLKSRDVPILKEKLKEWIVQAMHRRWIVAFCSAKMREGGPGATYILLRGRPEKKRIRVIG
jgi:DNA-nicking Smr family endonuclease